MANKSKYVVLCFFSLVACSDLVRAADRFNTYSQIEIDSSCNVTRFYGVPIKLTVAKLDNLSFPVRTRRVVGEDGTYIIAKIDVGRGIEAEVEFDKNDRLEILRTMSPNAVDFRGIGPGSPLSDVEAAWPNGRLYYGSEEGRYVRYMTGTNVIFTFNPDDMDPQAFDPVGKEVAVPNLKVQGIEIRSRPVPVAGSQGQSHDCDAGLRSQRGF